LQIERILNPQAKVVPIRRSKGTAG
jgi:hypothetical protein